PLDSLEPNPRITRVRGNPRIREINDSFDAPGIFEFLGFLEFLGIPAFTYTLKPCTQNGRCRIMATWRAHRTQRRASRPSQYNPRTMSGPEGSSIKRPVICAAGLPGPDPSCYAIPGTGTQMAAAKLS